MFLFLRGNRNQPIHRENTSYNGQKIILLTLLLFLLSGTFFLFFKATVTFPLCSDDFSYSYIHGSGGARVQKLSDVLNSQAHHYLTWGGRFWTHCVVQYLLMFDKWVFNLANVLVYALSTYFISRIERARFHPWYWLLSAATFWCIMPATGCTMFWLTGSVNYLWSSCINAIFLYVICSDRHKPHILMLPLSILAGNAHEGISAGVVVASVILLTLHRQHRRMYALMAACYVAGCLSNIFAPGNFVRLETLSNGETSICLLDILARLYLNSKSLIQQIRCINDIGVFISICMFSASILAFFRLLFINKRKAIITGSLIVGALSSLFLNLYTGTIYPRAMYGFCFITYILFFVSFSYVLPLKRTKNAYIPLFVLVLTLNAYELPKAAHAVQAMKDQLEKTRSETQKGYQLIGTTENFETADSRYMEQWGLGNNVIHNRPLSRYYGGVEFTVLNKKQKQFIEKNLPALKELPLGQITNFADNYHAIRITYSPTRVNLTLPPKELPYRFTIVREYVKNQPRTQHPMVIALHENYFIVWQTEEKAYNVSIKSQNGTTEVIIQAPLPPHQQASAY